MLGPEPIIHAHDHTRHVVRKRPTNRILGVEVPANVPPAVDVHPQRQLLAPRRVGVGRVDAHGDVVVDLFVPRADGGVRRWELRGEYGAQAVVLLDYFGGGAVQDGARAEGFFQLEKGVSDGLLRGEGRGKRGGGGYFEPFWVVAVFCSHGYVLGRLTGWWMGSGDMVEVEGSWSTAMTRERCSGL